MSAGPSALASLIEVWKLARVVLIMLGLIYTLLLKASPFNYMPGCCVNELSSQRDIPVPSF